MECLLFIGHWHSNSFRQPIHSFIKFSVEKNSIKECLYTNQHLQFLLRLSRKEGSCMCSPFTIVKEISLVVNCSVFVVPFKTRAQGLIENRHHRVWRNGLDMKKKYCFYRGPGFGSQYSLSSSQPCVTQASGDPIPSSDSHGHSTHIIHPHRHIHIEKIKTESLQ